jgi:hypothetical protein
LRAGQSRLRDTPQISRGKLDRLRRAPPTGQARGLNSHGPINRLQHFCGSCYPREDQSGLHTGSLLDSRQHGLIVTPAEEMRIRILLQPAESPLRTRLPRKGGPDSPDRSRPGDPAQAGVEEPHTDRDRTGGGRLGDRAARLGPGAGVRDAQAARDVDLAGRGCDAAEGRVAVPARGENRARPPAPFGNQPRLSD